ncbi:hypothetical protein NIES25_57380 (plasmid) [Nostoc linckia NIES-25]|nr:hypothetical protein NIES25_57380 [Nostoc linckia NIES-25]
MMQEIFLWGGHPTRPGRARRPSYKSLLMHYFKLATPLQFKVYFINDLLLSVSPPDITHSFENLYLSRGR